MALVKRPPPKAEGPDTDYGASQRHVPYVGWVPVKGRRGAEEPRALLKRLLDTFLSLVLLVLLAPLLILVAVVIKIDSRGPVLFHQDRVGSKRSIRDGAIAWEATTFRMHKFRSMFGYVGDEEHSEHVKAFVQGTAKKSGKEGSTFKLVNDPRVTRVGRIIRRTSIDELPQLLNVLVGEMSLVGPRPVPIYEAQHHEPPQMERLHALPGITGYWQVFGRGEVPFEEMMRMDIFYVRNQSVLLDLKLLALTIPAVLAGRGAE